ncbi:MAG TPA: ribose-5-phosphate isomerase RpiA [Chitinophagaceae bacterium]|nr:ribose-5-phosphate isomerase RpiA [Chitinophagaceae bacterium]
MNAKQQAGEKAADYIRPGMTVGLGTGSTAYWAIREIGHRVQQGLQIKAVASSHQTETFARELGIPMISFAAVNRIDLDIDGADEVDQGLNLIKGGGGALLREKIIAYNSKQFIVVADESKLVKQLGTFPLPVEVFPFAWELTFSQLKSLGAIPVLRNEGTSPFVTDNGNYIIDCSFGPIPDPVKLQKRLKDIAGIAENGLFLGMADIVLFGRSDGEVEILEKKQQ